MNIIKVLSKVRKILTVITDFLIKGRQEGLWHEKPTIGRGKPK